MERALISGKTETNIRVNGTNFSNMGEARTSSQMETHILVSISEGDQMVGESIPGTMVQPTMANSRMGSNMETVTGRRVTTPKTQKVPHTKEITNLIRNGEPELSLGQVETSIMATM